MRVYLDVCATQRPLDSPNQIRIILETEAALGIIALCELGRQLQIVSSDALIYEPNTTRCLCAENTPWLYCEKLEKQLELAKKQR
ncbi:MAG: hypothetical protein ACUVR8_13410 [Acidobacteriota bacterium]